jgi:hypothetical protein
MLSDQPSPEEVVTDEAFAAHVDRLAEVFGPEYVCQDRTKFVDDLVYFMHYGTPSMTQNEDVAGNAGLRQFHESSLDGTDRSGVFHIEDAYEIAFKHLYETRTLQFPEPIYTTRPSDMHPQPPTIEGSEPAVAVVKPEDYEEDRDPASMDLLKRAPLISHLQSRESEIQSWANQVLLSHPQVVTASAKLPRYPTFLDALAAMRDSNIVDVPAPAELVGAASSALNLISDESLVCIAKKAGVMCLERAAYDSLRLCAEEYLVKTCNHLNSQDINNTTAITSAQAVQDVLSASRHETILGYGYKGLVIAA